MPGVRFARRALGWGLAMVVLAGVTSTRAVPYQDRPQDASASPGAVQRAPAGVPVPEPDQRTLRHYRTGMIAWGFEAVILIAVPAVVLISGIMPRVRSVLMRFPWPVQAAVIAGFYAAIALAVMLPVAFYDEFIRARTAGLTDRPAAAWTIEWSIRAALTVGFAALAAPLGYLFVRLRPGTWWLWGGLSGGILAFTIGMAFPVWVAPLFDRFEPMENTPIREELHAVAVRAGVPSPRFYVVSKREETEMVNAYVAGFGGTKRIVLWDTLIDALDPDELRFVVAHELAHDVLDHRWWMLGAGTLLLTSGLWGVHVVARGILRHAPPRIGVSALGDPASLPVVVLAGTLVAIPLLPAALAANRHLERDADRFAIEVTHDNHAAATTWLELQGHNLTHPDPGIVYRLFRATHPPLGDRIRFANEHGPTGPTRRPVPAEPNAGEPRPDSAG